MIEKHFLSTGLSPANAVFDPIPSYDGQWLFTIDNLRKNAKSKEIWDDFYKEIYEEPLRKLFETDRILDLHVGMISKPTEEMKGRCLRFNKVDFFVELISFLNQNIDRIGLNDKENNARIMSLLNHIKGNNEELNIAFSESLKEHARRLKDVLDKGFNSEYFDCAMKDYEPYKNRISFEDYIKNNYLISSKFQVGMLRLDDFFDRNIDFNKLYELFNPDTFCLLFAKIIYEFNLKIENEYKRLDNSYGYLCYYKMMIDKVVGQDDKRYDPKIFYTLESGKKIKYSRWNFMNEYHELMERHPEAGSFKLPVLEDDDHDRYKDISLMEKITRLYREDTKVNWEFLPEGEEIKRSEKKSTKKVSSSKVKDKEELIQEINMRINILENSGFIGRPVKGLNTFSGYYAFIYPNGKVILEKFWESENTLNPAVNSATYVMTIDNFIEMSKISRINLIEYIKTLPEIGVKRIFHTNINNWQRNLYDKINGTYRIEDAIDFINSLKGDKKYE